MIGSTFKYNDCKPDLHTRNTRVKLDEPSIYRYGLGTLETERSNVNHIVNLRIILIAAQKNYVLDAQLGGRTIAGAYANVLNVLTKARYDDYLIV